MPANGGGSGDFAAMGRSYETPENRSLDEIRENYRPTQRPPDCIRATT
ncbi:hypothetical protein SAMN05216603_106132 [Pseudomonas benzenivorans]|nr:hypothetical protein SAMN05216603_106132 [Pseudomonas benzenivorans]